MEQTLNAFFSGHIYDWLYDGFIALVILTMFGVFFTLTRKPLVRFLNKHDVDDYLSDVAINSLYRTSIIIIAVITALAQLGVNVIAAMTGFGIAGIAISFAAKDTLGNIIAGFMILWDKPFMVHDWIEVDDQFGKVQAITLRTTRILTLDGQHVVIPNQTIINTDVVNSHHTKPIRTGTHLYLPYGSDVDRAVEVIKQAAETVKGRAPNKEVVVGCTNITEGIVEFVALVWAPDARSSVGLGSEVRKVCMKALIQSGFSAPLPVSLSANPRVKQAQSTSTKAKSAKSASTKK